MAVIYNRERIQSKITKEKSAWGAVWEKSGSILQDFSPNSGTEAVLIPSSQLWQCCLPVKLIRDVVLKFFFFWLWIGRVVHIGTLCLAQTQILDAQKESRCPA